MVFYLVHMTSLQKPMLLPIGKMFLPIGKMPTKMILSCWLLVRDPKERSESRAYFSTWFDDTPEAMLDTANRDRPVAD